MKIKKRKLRIILFLILMPIFILSNFGYFFESNYYNNKIDSGTRILVSKDCYLTYNGYRVIKSKNYENPRYNMIELDNNFVNKSVISLQLDLICYAQVMDSDKIFFITDTNYIFTKDLPSGTLIQGALFEYILKNKFFCYDGLSYLEFEINEDSNEKVIDSYISDLVPESINLIITKRNGECPRFFDDGMDVIITGLENSLYCNMTKNQYSLNIDLSESISINEEYDWITNCSGIYFISKTIPNVDINSIKISQNEIELSKNLDINTIKSGEYSVKKIDNGFSLSFRTFDLVNSSKANIKANYNILDKGKYLRKVLYGGFFYVNLFNSLNLMVNNEGYTLSQLTINLPENSILLYNTDDNLSTKKDSIIQWSFTDKLHNPIILYNNKISFLSLMSVSVILITIQLMLILSLIIKPLRDWFNKKTSLTLSAEIPNTLLSLNKNVIDKISTKWFFFIICMIMSLFSLFFGLNFYFFLKSNILILITSIIIRSAAK